MNKKNFFQFFQRRQVFLAAFLLIACSSKVQSPYPFRDQPPAPSGAILFTGSSSIERWVTLSQDFPEFKVLNHGISGSTYKDLDTNLDQIVLDYAPTTLVLYSGDNDLYKGQQTEEILAHIDSIVARVHARFPKTLIYILSVKPSPRNEAKNLLMTTRDLNLALENRARSPKASFEFVDIFTVMTDHMRPRSELFLSDGVHMTPPGYKIWADVLRPLLIRDLHP